MMQFLVERLETYTIVLQPEPEGGFTVTCPALPEVITYGETVEEARAQAKEAIEALLESLTMIDPAQASAG